jgi:manganese/iron transport system substrate-binding protein
MILDKQRSGLARGTTLVTAAVLACALGACAAKAPQAQLANQPAASPGRVKVVATMSTLAALAKSVGGDDADIVSLVPVGVSPETYDPSPRDLIALSQAQLIIENGAGLELWLAKLLRSAANRSARVIVLSDGLPIEGAIKGQPGNPHLWLDPHFAKIYVSKIAAALREIDPAHAAHYSANERAELARLDALDAWIKQQIAQVPEQKRAMITFHDAWFYFDRRYGLRDIGAIEPSPGQEPSAAWFAKLIALARENNVRAIFAEPQFSPKLASELASSAGIKTVSDLYDDTLGTTPSMQTYEGIMHYDVDTIVKALNS